jgi:NAD(P)-dependent dehydrogenase (short-subunit alcohol dehydrogenase family)
MSKVLLVTGGGRGIGAATALYAAEKGYAVGVNYRSNDAAAAAVVAQIEKAGGRAVALKADIAREEEVMRLFAELDEKLGPIDALVNNAGIVEQQTRIEGIDQARLARVFATNVFGSFTCAREAVKRMSTRHGGNGGAIVNVSSAASRLGSAGSYIDYAASKGAIDTFTLGLAREVAAEGIRVNAVRAGMTFTEIHADGGEPDRVARRQGSLPMQRGAQPEEIARTIVWLLSEEASYITAALVDAAGGL